MLASLRLNEFDEDRVIRSKGFRIYLQRAQEITRIFSISARGADAMRGKGLKDARFPTLQSTGS